MHAFASCIQAIPELNTSEWACTELRKQNGDASTRGLVAKMRNEVKDLKDVSRNCIGTEFEAFA